MNGGLPDCYQISRHQQGIKVRDAQLFGAVSFCGNNPADPRSLDYSHKTRQHQKLTKLSIFAEVLFCGNIPVDKFIGIIYRYRVTYSICFLSGKQGWVFYRARAERAEPPHRSTPAAQQQPSSKIEPPWFFLQFFLVPSSVVLLKNLLQMMAEKLPSIMIERPKMPRATWEALRNHTVRERQRKKLELEQNAEVSLKCQCIFLTSTEKSRP